MPIISDQAVSDLKDAVQAEGTIVQSVVMFVAGIPKMIRDAVTAAQNDGSDVSTAVEDVVKSIQAQSSQLTAAITTTPNGDAAPVGNLPASVPGDASAASSGAGEQDANVK